MRRAFRCRSDGEHADMALELRVLQVLPAGDLPTRGVGVVANPGEAGLPRDRERVALVEGWALELVGRVGVEVGAAEGEENASGKELPCIGANSG